MGFFNQDSGKKLCALLHSHYGVDDPKRKVVAQQVIDKGQGLNDPLAWLACAFAYHYLGAQHRQDAVAQFERYLSAPIKSNNFPMGSVYVTLAELYEADFDFKSAEQFYILYEAELKQAAKKFKHAQPDPLPNVKLGRLYLKMSTARAIEYWQSVTKTSEYKKYPTFKRTVDAELAAAQEKHAKGYVYKPRGTK
jgi:hypothetical protein